MTGRNYLTPGLSLPLSYRIVRPITATHMDGTILIQSGMGLTTKEIQRKTFDSQGDFEESAALAEAVFEICGEHFNVRQFGRRVRGFVGRVHGGKCIEADSAVGGVCR